MKTISLGAFLTVVLFASCNYVVLILICRRLWAIDPGYCNAIRAPYPRLSHWLAITKRHRMFDRMVSKGEIFATFPELHASYYKLWLTSRWATRISLIVFLILAICQV